jgi:hypothetical protein
VRARPDDVGKPHLVAVGVANAVVAVEGEGGIPGKAGGEASFDLQTNGPLEDGYDGRVKGVEGRVPSSNS